MWFVSPLSSISRWVHQSPRLFCACVRAPQVADALQPPPGTRATRAEDKKGSSPQEASDGIGTQPGCEGKLQGAGDQAGWRQARRPDGFSLGVWPQNLSPKPWANLRLAPPLVPQPHTAPSSELLHMLLSVHMWGGVSQSFQAVSPPSERRMTSEPFVSHMLSRLWHAPVHNPGSKGSLPSARDVMHVRKKSRLPFHFKSLLLVRVWESYQAASLCLMGEPRWGNSLPPNPPELTQSHSPSQRGVCVCQVTSVVFDSVQSSGL